LCVRSGLQGICSARHAFEGRQAACQETTMQESEYAESYVGRFLWRTYLALGDSLRINTINVATCINEVRQRLKQSKRRINQGLRSIKKAGIKPAK